MHDVWVQDDFPLTLRHVMERMRGMYGDAEVVTQREDGRTRISGADLGARIDRLAGALRTLGVQPGDRVATFAFNTQEHLELYHAVPCSGAVLHMVNIRLFDEDLEYIFGHAEDRVLFVDAILADRIAPLMDRLPTLRSVVVIGGDAAGTGIPGAIGYEELLAAHEPRFAYPDLDDRSAAGLCYTSGTTGRPKGVVYTHRSQTLHALAACAADTLGVSSRDRILPLVPMFHANAWGLPYAAAMTGAELVLPGPHTQPAALAAMLEEERVTIAAGVPTVWMDLLRHLDAHGGDLSRLRTMLCGGAAVPLALMQAFQERHGVRVFQSWGMTETGPLASVARPPRDDSEWSYRDTAGRVAPLVEVRVVADDGAVLPHDGEATGEVQIRGPWIAAGYYRDPAPGSFDGGWLRTGDIAAVDPRGYVRISDRAKDVIKSGGEWISSVALENELVAHPDVVEAAVIAKPDERWTERPLACVVLAPGSTCTADDLQAHLAGRVAKWWLPDEVAFIDAVPKTGTGKYDKKVLRARLADGSLGRRVTVGPA
ncbi:3-methylmercaptopropionyl-CoA ligase [Paraconexibacter sp. AEG42_29]|uniref:3-methylmercaptopropionyl-CoA ligase n=1 Tax=Paraconexibacter sp. AEG42_29 TaxID=2997339 RepID=A0AAU7APB6_9ACTN